MRRKNYYHSFSYISAWKGWVGGDDHTAYSNITYIRGLAIHYVWTIKWGMTALHTLVFKSNFNCMHDSFQHFNWTFSMITEMAEHIYEFYEIDFPQIDCGWMNIYSIHSFIAIKNITMFICAYQLYYTFEFTVSTSQFRFHSLVLVHPSPEFNFPIYCRKCKQSQSFECFTISIFQFWRLPSFALKFIEFWFFRK